ncbi:hypothetical protein R3P38DRAFT_3391249 [Favolaschia claudopus]|uniref:ABM domain-containing protein n=1 Tax=Favolaschia claudopus TaxID=2862362 RepID=A0AAW0CLU9_9AGAR
MPTVIQRITFTASSSFTSDPNVFNAALQILKKAPGFIGSFHGLQIDDGKTGYFITVWSSPEHFSSFAQPTSFPAYTQFLDTLKPYAVNGKLETHHVYTPDTIDPHTALRAPITELVLFKFKPGVTLAQIGPLYDELGVGLDRAKGSHPPCFWAVSKESNEDEVLVFVGWDTVEEHWDAVKEGTELHAVIQKLLEKSSFVLGHAKLME